MSIVSVNLESIGEAGQSDLLVREYDVVWLVAVSTTATDALSATNTGLLPLLFSTYAFYGSVDLGATLRNYKVARVGPKLFRVTGHYSSARTPRRYPENPTAKAGTGTSKGNDAEQNPLLRPPDINWGVEKYQEAYQYDRDGAYVCNSALQPLEPAPVRDRSRLTLTIVRNEPYFNAAQALTYMDVVNSHQITVAGHIFLTGRLKMGGITGQSQWENNQFFYRITYPMEIRVEPDTTEVPLAKRIGTDGVIGVASVYGWSDIAVDQGLMERKTPTSLLSHIKDPTTGTDVSGPWLLDGTGKAMVPTGLPPIPFRHIFRPYLFKDFVPLALPA